MYSKHLCVSSQTGTCMLIVISSANAKGTQEELTFVFHFAKNFEGELWPGKSRMKRNQK